MHYFKKLKNKLIWKCKNHIEAKNSPLAKYKKNYFSQYGEDGIIEKIFDIIKTENKWCVEFGAWDGKHLSNTRYLLEKKLWSGVLIEADRERYNNLKNNFINVDRVHCLNRYVEFEGKNTLDNILAETKLPINFDLLSIDIDGNDYHVWNSLKNYTPRVVIIEFNPTIPNDIEFIQEKNMNIYQGNSLLALVNLGRCKGYELIAATNTNAFFIKDNLYNRFGIKNNSLEVINARNKYYYTRLFQLYDGTLVLEGFKKLIWKNIDIDQEKIQILTKDQRTYGDPIKK